MKILIVNCYSNTAQGARQFEEFESIIKQYFLRQKDLMDTETEFFVCDHSNIGDFLYEMNGNFISKEAAKSFDFIDMVFVEGDANLRPWSPKATLFLMLLKNCLKTNKILWASQFAMQAMVYLIATDLERPISIVNGVNGDPVANNKTFKKEYPTSKTDFFLDNVSGDLYQWDSDIMQWKPVHNTGLHFRKKAQESQDLGKLVMKTEIYRAKTQHPQTYTIFEEKNNETICYVKKALMNHYALLDLEFEFLVPSKNQWDAHPIAFLNPTKTYTVLADSRFTMQIIEPSASILATQFNLSKKYPFTIQVLCNFIKHQLDKVRMGKRSIPIKSVVNLTEEDSNSIESMLKKAKKGGQMSAEELKKQSQVFPCFRHSGFAIKKAEKADLVVENNALHPRSVTALDEIEQFNNDGRISKIAGVTTGSVTAGSRPYTALKRSTMMNGSSMSGSSMHRITSASTVRKVFRKSQQQQLQEELEEIYGEEDLVDQKDAFIKNQSEIRLMLHPKLPREALPQSENLWVAGAGFQKNLSKSNQLSSVRAQEQQTVIKVPSIGPMKKLQMRTQSAASLKSTSLSDANKRPNKNPFMKDENIIMPSSSHNLNLTAVKSVTSLNDQRNSISDAAAADAGFDDCRRKPIVRRSGPYLTEKEMADLRDREARKLNIGDRQFHTGAVKGYKMMGNILFDNSYKPPSSHQYREVNFARWVSNSPFLL